MATLPIGQTVKLINLPVDHGARCNGDHAVIIGSSAFQGRTFYAVKTHPGAQANFYPVDAVNVVATTNPTPPLGIANVVTWNGAPAHHSAAP